MEGDKGTWSHCGSREPHPAHRHPVVFPEGPYLDVQCNGTEERKRARVRVYKTPGYTQTGRLYEWCVETSTQGIKGEHGQLSYKEWENFPTWEGAMRWAWYRATGRMTIVKER